MDPQIIAGISIVGGAIAAVGAPGVTFWVMKKMTKNFMDQNIEACKKCRGEMDSKLNDLAAQDTFILGRQATLREKELPSFAKRSDIKDLGTDIKQEIKDLGQGVRDDMNRMAAKFSSDIQRVHERIDHFQNGRKP